MIVIPTTKGRRPHTLRTIPRPHAMTILGDSRFLWRSLIVVWSSGSLQPTLREVFGGTDHRSVRGMLFMRTFSVLVPVIAELKDVVFINDSWDRPLAPFVAPGRSRWNILAFSVAQP